MTKPVRKSSNKNPPMFSHEFVIQNHADIVSCIAMIFVIGLLIQATTPIASIFIVLQHNVTDVGEIPMYTSGLKDWAAIFFYSLICIVIHAIIQEYILDKISKKFHLSKSKLAVFNTSGQLAIFYLISTLWGFDILLLREKILSNVSQIWSDYPAPMSFMFKLYLIIQISYIIHEVPELYFQRVKKEEYFGKICSAVIALAVVATPYFLNFNRLLIVLLVLHQTSELLIHTAQLYQIVDKEDKFTAMTRGASNAVMLVARFASIIVAVLTLWFGLARVDQEQNDVSGNYNTPAIRLGLLVAILGLQIYLTAVVLAKEIHRAKEAKAYCTSSQKTASKPNKKDKSKKSKKNVEESDLPEVDQNTNKNLRIRAQTKAK